MNSYRLVLQLQEGQQLKRSKLMKQRRQYHCIWVYLLLTIAVGCSPQAEQEKAPASSQKYPATGTGENTHRGTFSFDDIAEGKLPQGWKIAATNPKGGQAEWRVVANTSAPSAPNVLTITKINDTFGGVFNLFKSGSYANWERNRFREKY